MSVNDVKDLKIEAMNYIYKTVRETGDEHEISCTATYVTEFINYLEDKANKEEEAK